MTVHELKEYADKIVAEGNGGGSVIFKFCIGDMEPNIYMEMQKKHEVLESIYLPGDIEHCFPEDKGKVVIIPMENINRL